MPRTIESIVDCHRAATERRNAGLPAWAETVNLRDIWNADGLSFTESRDQIVAKLRATQWFKNADPDDFDDVHETIDYHLANAVDEDDFNEWWDTLYDLADRDRIWIALI